MFQAFYKTFVGLKLVNKFVKNVLPIVDKELLFWQACAANCTDSELREQALASIRDKKFHCQGGSVYSLHDGVNTKDFVRLVVALQTISDYLDNLCDRAGIYEEAAFRQLHLAMTDALNPDAGLSDYYRYYPYKNDGGYLNTLVSACQLELGKLPSYHLIKSEVLKLAGLYSELQTFKHLDPSIREDKMTEWLNKHIADYPDINIWELAAATGSTLGMFMLCAAAHNVHLTEKCAIDISRAYFPWISGLHILLDYFIDREEDLANGDLNFTFYYKDAKQLTQRLRFFSEQALVQTKKTPNPIFAKTVVCGLLALYLSDPKTKNPKEKAVKRALLKSSGLYTNLLYFICRLLRYKKTL
ncbi:tetraprenyl-beta-curcumene synthase family protein [Dendrosporobacter sp. 1207_IL3150]|uniref:tetraprenyl-beta-curcumene synthase family protein n=1 Tax=Dendrosporobacter sp. 1207_IL3150 TaxID=3084054 RepID=UPI002FD8CE9A